MSVLVVGISHHSAPVSVLERLAPGRDETVKLLRDVLDPVAGNEHVVEATVLATCNRIEIYAEVARFHGSVEALSRSLCDRAQERAEAFVPYLYVHYDDAAVSHLFHVASGLDSMVVGEGQILGQVRDALRFGQESGSVGPVLNPLFQQALRVGKRVHAETEIDRAALSLVSVALDAAEEHVGGVPGKRVLIVGAGSMAALAVSTVSRLGAGDIAIANRTNSNATRLADKYDGRAVELSSVDRELSLADIVISCTGSADVVLPLSQVAAARRRTTHPVAVIDLALPHDVDPAVVELTEVSLVTLSGLAEQVNQGAGEKDVAAARGIVAQEIGLFLAARRSASVTPTVVALRSMATGVVEAEMERLVARLPDLDPKTRAEVEQSVQRVADKLLHQPTVRVRELANDAGALSYASALAELFALDLTAVDAVTRPGGVP
jgi:glutamyl-tRNA reductase